MCHFHLLPPVCPLFALAGCCVASYCIAFATHSLDAQPPLNVPAGCSNATWLPASAAHLLSMLLPLDVLPPSPTAICLSFALAGGCITSHCTAFATHPLYVMLPLNAPAGCSVASCCAAFATHSLECRRCSTCQLVVALPLIALPLPLIFSARPFLSMRHLHLPSPVCFLSATGGCHVAGLGLERIANNTLSIGERTRLLYCD